MEVMVNRYRSLLLLPFLLFSISQPAVNWSSAMAKIAQMKAVVSPYAPYIMPSAVTIGTLSVANKFLSARQIAATTASLIGIGAVVYSYKYLQHRFALSNIERIIDLSRNQQDNGQSARNQTFRYCTWKENAVAAPRWQDPCDIITNKTAVKQQLINDIKNGLVPVYDTAGKQLEIDKITNETIKASLAAERAELLDCLRAINGFSNIADAFIKDFAKFRDPNLSTICTSTALCDNEKIELCASALINIYLAFIDAIINHVTNQFKDSCKLVQLPSYNPYYWYCGSNYSLSIAPQHARAAAVYGKVLKALIRLLALENAVSDIDFKAPFAAGSVQEQVNSIKKSLDEIINAQPGVDGIIEYKNRQITRIVGVQDSLNKLKLQVSTSYKDIIEKMLKEINSISIQVHNSAWTQDIINRLRNNVLSKLDTIK
jgi:hypothetical protein